MPVVPPRYDGSEPSWTATMSLPQRCRTGRTRPRGSHVVDDNVSFTLLLALRPTRRPNLTRTTYPGATPRSLPTALKYTFVPTLSYLEVCPKALSPSPPSSALYATICRGSWMERGNSYLNLFKLLKIHGNRKQSWYSASTAIIGTGSRLSRT